MALIDSLPIINLEIDCEVQLRGELAKRLVEEAEYRGVDPVELLADLIEVVLGEDKIDELLGPPKRKTLIKLDASTPSLYGLKNTRV